MVNENITDEILEEWAREIDPDGTFLEECEDAVNWRKSLKP